MRSQTEVVQSIMNTIVRANHKVNRNRLTMRANLSTEMYNKYIPRLQQDGLIAMHQEGSQKFFTLTDRGYLHLQSKGVQ